MVSSPLYFRACLTAWISCQKGVRASWDGFERKIGRLWTPEIVKGKTITSEYLNINKEALTFRKGKHLEEYETLTLLNVNIVLLNTQMWHI